MIVIIDYGLGNLGSIKNMLQSLGFESVISADPELINTADKLILPGVGSFDRGMQNLTERNLIPVLNRRVLEEQVPILGICLGMQLFGMKSEEGTMPGLSWIDAEALKFKSTEQKRFPVPHLGWEYVTITSENDLIAQEADTRFYFAHSYYVKCHDPAAVFLKAHYIHEFDAGVRKGNIIGVQFHPEKSHRFGLQLLNNFVNKF